VADLKTAAKQRAGKTTSALGTAAKARAKSKAPAEDDGMSVEDLAAPPTEHKPMPDLISGQVYDAPPPLPPALMYLRMYATIPALRRRQGGPM
jgi:hypothetical protein